jgi:uncharacterized protein
MKAKEHPAAVDRREFLYTSTGAFGGALALLRSPEARAADPAPLTVEEAARKVGRLPRRKLGGGSREISVLVGGTSWSQDVVDAGIACGVNYWHKAERFRLNPEEGRGALRTPAAMLKDRDAFFCEVVVDRVGAGHETGTIDEEAHYRFVKEAIAQSGLRYFDDMVFHFGYHNVAEYRKERGFLRAYERLKAEGLVRHLALTQHHYNGNAKVPGGESAAEILTAIMADGLYEHAQFFYSYGEDAEVETFVRSARQKGFGTIAMKTTRALGRMQSEAAFMKTLPAGVSPYQALARWLTTETSLDAAVLRLKNLEEFVDTYGGAGKALRAADRAALTRVAAYADRHACRLCNKCMGHCPEGVPIADVLRCERYALDHGNVAKARRTYAALGRPAARCRACGECVPHCPLALTIPEKLARVHGLLA